MKFAAQRRAKLRRLIKRSGANAILVTNETNVSYLTGFTGDSSFLYMTQDKSLLLSDSRYTTQIEEECEDLEAVCRTAKQSMVDLVNRCLKTTRPSQVAVEAGSLTKSEYDRFESHFESTGLVPTEGLVESLRAIKDRGEIEEIQCSITMAQRAFEVIRASLRGDQTERDIAHGLEHQIRLFGGDGCSFEPIVGVGPRSALPHATKTWRRIEESPFVLIDWGAKAGRYMSDLTRVLATGKISPKLERIYGVVLSAQLAAIEKIRPGVPMHEVDHAARSVIEDAGHGRHFGHGLGHGIGLEIHEAPRLSPTDSTLLEAGMVVTVEPGIYLPGWGGVRIEDDVLVTQEGHQVLSDLPKTFESCHVPL